MPRSSIFRRFSVFVRTKCEMWQSIKALTPPPNTFPLYRPTRIFRTRIDRSVFQKIGWHHQRIIPVVAYRNRAWHNPELWQPWWEAQWNSPQWFGIKKKKTKRELKDLSVKRTADSAMGLSQFGSLAEKICGYIGRNIYTVHTLSILIKTEWTGKDGKSFREM